MKRSFRTLALLPLSLAGIAVGAYSAQAANINPAGVPCFTCIQGSNTPPSSAVAFSIDTVANTVDFNFIPSAGPVNTPNFNVTGASAAFTEFAGSDGIISDINNLPFLLPSDPFPLPTPVDPFLVLDPGAADGEDFFIADSISQPIFTNSGGNAVFFTSVTGTWVSGDGTEYDGGLTISATFNGQSTAEVIADASDGTPVLTSWSFTGSISCPDGAPSCVPTQDVPEPNLVSSLAVVAGSAFLFRRKKEQQ
jgi:hypothetical protein